MGQILKLYEYYETLMAVEPLSVPLEGKISLRLTLWLLRPAGERDHGLGRKERIKEKHD